MNSKPLCDRVDRSMLNSGNHKVLNAAIEIVQDMSDRIAALPPDHSDEEVKDIFRNVLVLEKNFKRITSNLRSLGTSSGTVLLNNKFEEARDILTKEREPLPYAGAGMMANGTTVTELGTSVTETVLLKNELEEAQSIMTNHREDYKELTASFKREPQMRKRFTEAYPKWKKIREDSIQKLKALEASINEDRYNCNVSKLAGASTAAVGGLLTLGATGMTIETVGAAAPLVYAGGAMIASGSATTFGTSMTETLLLKSKVEEAKNILTEDKEHYEELTPWFKHVRELQEALDAVFGAVTEAVIKK